ncbi:MAG: metallophosphoesterase [Halodesulfurarchaeum sp.]
MPIGVISDTHDNVEAVRRATNVLEERDVETVLHCGDVIAPPVVPFFEGFEVHAVLGNNDGEVSGLDSALSDLGMGSTLHGRFAELRIDGVDVAMLHGEDRSEVRGHAESGEYDLVCYGHHHERELVEEDGTTLLNPGAHFPTVPSEHRTVAIVDLPELDVEFVEC